MSEQQTQQPVLLNINPTIVKAKFNLELSEVGFQNIQNSLDALEIREDNLPIVKPLLEQEAKIIKKLEEIHKNGKAPYWEIGKMYDTVLSDMKKIVAEIFSSKKDRYKTVATEVARKAAEAEAEKARKERIQMGIQGNLTYYSQQISLANTSVQLLDVERKINLEKANKGKYMEFYDEAVEKFTSLLNNTLKTQKQKVKELEDLEAQKRAAEQLGDDSTVLELIDKKEALETSIEEVKTLVQENVLNELTKPIITEAAPILPTIKPKYQKWKHEVVDISLLHKKMPHLTKVVPNEEAIDELMATYKKDGTFENKDEHLLNGIRFFLDKKFI